MLLMKIQVILTLVPSGWDMFLLDYHVEAPISTIFSPTAIEKYHRIFNFLFGLQRIQSDISRTWNKFTKGLRIAYLRLRIFDDCFI